MGEVLGTYEMLWDCRNCGTPKLLGLSHRRCPNCGGAQDPTWRYFPSDEDKVLAQDHKYAGADRICPACDTPMGAAAAFCVNCGRALDGAKAVARRADQERGEGESFTGETIDDAKRERAGAKAPPASEPEPPSPWRRRLIIGGAVMLAVVLVAIFWKRSAALEVRGHSWKREIKIERFAARSDSAWCDDMPSDAYHVSRHREQRSTRDVPDGEECSVQRKDQGNGTYRDERECHTKYRSEPVYDVRCSYTIDRWQAERSEVAQGINLHPEPQWPEVHLGQTGQCFGCEREGNHIGTYTVELSDPAKKKQHACKFEQDKWSSFAVGSHWQGRVRTLTGGLDCASLAAPK